MRIFITLLLSILFIADNFGQTQYSFTSAPYLTSTTNAPNSSSTDVTISSGTISTNIITGSYFPNEPYIQGTTGWSSTTQVGAKEFCFNVIPNPGYSIDITNFSYQAYASPAGPSATGFRIGSTYYSGSNLPSGGSSITTINQSISNQTNLTTATTICIQGYHNGSRTTSGAGDFRVDEFIATISSTLLPVKLASISATNDNTTNTLNWQTASEINNSHFEILHSTDARSYTVIGKEMGNGNTSENKSYSYEHQNVKPGTHYYQLRQVDYDGQSEIFGPVSVTVEGNKLRFYPTVAENTIHFNGVLDNENYAIYSVDGKTFQIGKVTQQIDISNIPNGVYYIKYGNETSQLIKL